MTEKKKWAFIVNPIAGNGDGLRMVPEIQKRIEQFDIEAEFFRTERHGHAIELSKQCVKDGFETIIAVGGDGTMNEVARAVPGTKNIVTGLIPAGTGNDFNQILGFPDRFEEEHWRIFFERNIINMDYGTCNGIPFLNGMGLGFDAEVAAKNYVSPDQVKRGGKGKYIGNILSTLFFFKEYMVTIRIEDREKEETECFINTVSNGRRYAGGFYLTPHAIANDGLLDVCMIKNLGLLKRLDILMKVSKGAHTTDRKVKYYSTKKLEVDFGKEVPFHVDGELYHASQFKIEIHPARIPIIYNPYGKHYFNV